MKNGTKLFKRRKPKPLVGLAVGVTGVDWASAWLEDRQAYLEIFAEDYQKMNPLWTDIVVNFTTAHCLSPY